jgi:hypothetical protein
MRRWPDKSAPTTQFAENPRRYAALLAFTGGLIRHPEYQLKLTGDLAGTPILLSWGDPTRRFLGACVTFADLLQEIRGRVTIRSSQTI